MVNLTIVQMWMPMPMMEGNRSHMAKKLCGVIKIRDIIELEFLSM